MEAFIDFCLKIAVLYLCLGVGWALWLHVVGLRRLDPGVEGAGIFFRLLITPGLIALWPLMAARALAKIRGRELLGGSQSPLTSRALRSAHLRIALVSSCVLPLLVALAIFLRPTEFPTQVESPPGVPARLPASAHGFIAFKPDLRVSAIRGKDDLGRAEIILVSHLGTGSGDLLLYWSQEGEDPKLDRSVLLGNLPETGEARYLLPAEAASGEGELFLYALQRGTVLAIAPLADRGCKLRTTFLSGTGAGGSVRPGPPGASEMGSAPAPGAGS